jgi:hypothetical protein
VSVVRDRWAGALAILLSAAGITAITGTTTFAQTTTPIVAAFQSDLRAAEEKCPNTANAPQGRMLEAAACLYREWRSIWSRYSPPTLDLFDVFGKQGLEIARKFDIGDYSLANAKAEYQKAVVTLTNAIRLRISRSRFQLQIGDPTTAAAVGAGLKAARSQCPAPSAISQAALNEAIAYNECVIPRERLVWAQYYPKALPAHDAFTSQVANLSRKLRERQISITEYVDSVQSARFELVAAIQGQQPTTTSQTVTQSGSGGGSQTEASTTHSIDPAATCMLMSSVIGVFAGVITHRADSGLNSATAYLKGCTGQ